MAEFEVVALVLEAPEVIRRFAEHYVAEGAARVRVYYDGVPDPDLLDGIPNTELIACTPEFWAELGVEADGIVQHRQFSTYHHAYDRLEADWLVVCDADEIIAGDCSLGAFLDNVPSDAPGVLFPTAEAVFGPGDDPDKLFGATYFRTAMVHSWKNRLLRLRLFPKAFRRFPTNGLLGHYLGKHALRRGIPDVAINCHTTRVDGQDLPLIDPHDVVGGESFYCLHFDAMNYEQWRAKWLRRVRRDAVFNSRPARNRLLTKMADILEGNDAEARKAFAALYGLTERNRASLQKHGYCFSRTDTPRRLAPSGTDTDRRVTAA